MHELNNFLVYAFMISLKSTHNIVYQQLLTENDIKKFQVKKVKILKI